MINNIDLESIYKGFVRSYNSFCLPSDEEYPGQTTHAVLNYFCNLGRMLGFFPYCEWKRMDLSWLNSNDNTILHLEHENVPTKAKETIDKLFKRIERKIPFYLIRDYLGK